MTEKKKKKKASATRVAKRPATGEKSPGKKAWETRRKNKQKADLQKKRSEPEVEVSPTEVKATVEVVPGLKVSQSFSLKALFAKVKAFFKKLFNG